MERFSITLYGTPAVGFTYLLTNDAGFVETTGRASDRGPARARETGDVAHTKGEAIALALAYVTEGALVAVHQPNGRTVNIGRKIDGAFAKFAK